MSFLSYLRPIPDEPSATYVSRRLDTLYEALREHPEDALEIKQQILIFSQTHETEDKVIDLALELMAMDVEKIYAFDYFIILGRMYAQKKDITKAVEYYNKAIATDPNTEDAILELAGFYEEQFNFDAAIDTYNYLDKECFNDIKDYIYRQKGVCYYKKREYQKSLECFQSSLAISSENDVEMVTDNIGGCYFNLENYTEAFSWFRKSLERNPQNATAHYGLGLCYHHTGDSLRSLHHYFEAIKLKPDYTEAYNNIASVSINQESDYKTGIEMLKKGIENCSDESVLTMIYLNLSRAYNTLGEFALADHYKAEYLKSWGFDFIIEEDDDDD